ncbi:hypothetical protein [Xanthobacter sediminis]
MNWMQTGSNRAFDLSVPRTEVVDLDVDVAESLAREPRFAGHVRAGSYSVAQHCVLGTDCILAETGSLELARAFLLHDGHEAYTKDIHSPLQDELDVRVTAALNHRLRDAGLTELPAGISRGLFTAGFRDLKRDLDIAIHAAAGAKWPLAPEIADQVKAWDLAMLAVERRQLLGLCPMPWHPSVEAIKPARLRGRITVWPWPRAADEWRMRLYQLFPHLKPAA